MATPILLLLHGEGDQLRDVLLIQSRDDNVLLATCHVRDREPDGWATRKLNLMDNVTRPLVVRTENRLALCSFTRKQQGRCHKKSGPLRRAPRRWHVHALEVRMVPDIAGRAAVRDLPQDLSHGQIDRGDSAVGRLHEGKATDLRDTSSK